MLNLSIRRWRWFNKFYANQLGYFWRECPLCHEMFGGHEYSKTVFFQNDRGSYVVCWRHTGEENV